MTLDHLLPNLTIAAPPMAQCAACQDSGYAIEMREGKPWAVRCACRRRRVAEQRWVRSGIPAKYALASFEGFVMKGMDPSVAMAARVCRGMVEEFLMPGRGRQGLLLTGNCGTGKTHLAAASLRAVMTQYGVEGRFYDMADLLTQIKRTFAHRQEMEEMAEAGYVKEFADIPALVVDELGGEKLTDWSYSEVSLLLNQRYNGQGAGPRLTIFTTNFPNLGPGAGVGMAETLGDRIGARMFSRLQEMCRVVEMTGSDYRRTR